MNRAANHTSQPRPRQGNTVRNGDPIMTRETEKNNKYKVAAAAVHKELITLVMDTYGRMDKPIINLLKCVAAHTANRASGNANERTQAIYTITPPNEFRNRFHLRNLAPVHVALITSPMQMLAGSTVTNDRHHGARHRMYDAHEHYVQPYPAVMNPPTCE